MNQLTNYLPTKAQRNGYRPNAPTGAGRYEPPTPRVVDRAQLTTMTITHKKLKDAITQVRRWQLENLNRQSDGRRRLSFVMVGPNGTGKTHIARAMLWSNCYSLPDKRGNLQPVAPIGKFFQCVDFIELLQSGNSVGELIGSDCPIVVLDDAGAEGNIQYVSAAGQRGEIQARYFKVIDFCYQHGISLIITASNEYGTIPALRDYLGGRCWSRLEEMAPFGYMRSFGPDKDKPDSEVPDYRKRVGGRL